MTFRRFEEIEAWKTARSIAVELNKIANGSSLARDYGLRDQLQRAAASVMSNIAEGLPCRSDREFARFLLIAKRSAAEVQSHLYVALDRGYIEAPQFSHVYQMIECCSRQLAGLISYLLKRKRHTRQSEQPTKTR